MNRTVWIDGARVALAPAALLGQGGEAEVYDLGDGRVVKWWKPADHPDFDGLPAAQDVARRRLVEQPAKLRALPGQLPAAVVAPCGFALAGKRSAQVVGLPDAEGQRARRSTRTASRAGVASIRSTAPSWSRRCSRSTTRSPRSTRSGS